MPWVCPNFVISTWWPQESQQRGLSHSSDRVLWDRLWVTSPLSSIRHDPKEQFPFLSHAFVRHLLCVSMDETQEAPEMTRSPFSGFNAGRAESFVCSSLAC